MNFTVTKQYYDNIPSEHQDIIFAKNLLAWAKGLLESDYSTKDMMAATCWGIAKTIYEDLLQNTKEASG